MSKARVIEKVTALQFAKWSFEHDVKEGLFDDDSGISKWIHLPEEERNTYLKEAEMYLGMSLSEWPVDILERL